MSMSLRDFIRTVVEVEIFNNNQEYRIDYMRAIRWVSIIYAKDRPPLTIDYPQEGPRDGSDT